MGGLGSVLSEGLGGRWAAGSGWNCAGNFFLAFRVLFGAVGQELRAVKLLEATQPCFGSRNSSALSAASPCLCPSPLNLVQL